MLFTSSDDFFQKASLLPPLSSEEEKQCAILMKIGDSEALQKIIDNYIPFTASYVKRFSGKYVSLELIYRCLNLLEREVKDFDFLKANESFTRRLGFALRQEITRYVVDC